MWIFFLVPVWSLHAVELDGGVVVRNHGWKLDVLPTRDALLDRPDLHHESSPNSNATQDLTVVRRHDESTLNKTHGSVRKEFPGAVQQDDTNNTLARTVALEVDAHANFIHHSTRGSNASEVNASTAIGNHPAEGVVRGSAVESAVHAESEQPKQLESNLNGSGSHGKIEQPERPEEPGLTFLTVAAGLSQARHVLAQIRQHMEGKMRMSEEGGLFEQMILAVLILIFSVILLAGANTAIRRYRERTQWAQSHDAARMRQSLDRGGDRSAVVSTRNRSPSTMSPVGPVGRTPSAQRATATVGRRQSTGASQATPFASVRASSARRASIDR
jgi:hypothetical protein